MVSSKGTEWNADEAGIFYYGKKPEYQYVSSSAAHVTAPESVRRNVKLYLNASRCVNDVRMPAFIIYMCLSKKLDLVNTHVLHKLS